MSGGVSFLSLSGSHAAVAAALHGASIDPGWSADSISVLLALPGVYGFIALVNGAPAGMILARTAADEGEILTLAVLPESRRSGVGAGLVQAALAFARRNGCRTVFLEVAEDNEPGKALYRRIGFQRVGLRPNYYEGPDGQVAAEILRLDLPPISAGSQPAF